MSTQLASYHYPAVESAKRLLGSLYAQQNNEKKFLATKDPTFRTNVTEEVEEFQRVLHVLRGQESSTRGLTLLQETGELLNERERLFDSAFQVATRSIHPAIPDYESKRDSLTDRMSFTLQNYIDLHEARVSVGVTESRASAAQAEAVTEQIGAGRGGKLYDSAPSPRTAGTYQTHRTGEFWGITQHQGSGRAP